jgi:DNA-binding CsgD family transcriptional regulator
MLTTTNTRLPALPSMLTDSLERIADQLTAYGLRLQLVSHLGGTTSVRRIERPAPCPLEDILTPGELRIARLVAAGATNRQTAAWLRISPKTVEAHLTHVYRKTGARSRTELAGRVAREDAARTPDPQADVRRDSSLRDNRSSGPEVRTTDMDAQHFRGVDRV